MSTSGTQVSVRNDFKKKVLNRIRDEFEKPMRVPVAYPMKPTAKFIGLPEWAKVEIQHAPSYQRSHGGKNHRRYVRTGTITIKVSLPIDIGSARMDELTEALERMFEGRNIDGIDSSFPRVGCREAGLDETGRYNVLLCEVFFHYRQKK